MTADAVGGVWQYAVDLSQALAARGHRITLALLGPRPPVEERRRVEGLDGVRLIETGEPLDWLCDDPQRVVEAAKVMADIARQADADILHCNMPTLAGAATFPMPVVAVAHGCVTTWWQAAKEEPLVPAYRWHREMMRRGLAAADVVIAPSASHAASLQRCYSLRTPPRVVHNGRALRRGRAQQGEPLAAAITVGRLWDEAKNARLLDQVAASLDVPFLAAGSRSGPHGETAALAHLEPLGQLADVELAALLAKRPVFVSAARFEPFGLAVLEAAAAGCALVLSDIATFRELWDGAAIFADPGSPESFRAAIAAALPIPARERLGTAAAARARRFTPGATAAAMSAIYDELPVTRRVAA